MSAQPRWSSPPTSCSPAGPTSRPRAGWPPSAAPIAGPALVRPGTPVMAANLLCRVQRARYPAAGIAHIAMRPLAKVGLVGAGYVGATALVVAAHVLLTGGPDQQHESGMAAFGDA